MTAIPLNAKFDALVSDGILFSVLEKQCFCLVVISVHRLYLQTGPEGLQRLEDRHGDGSFMHLDPQVPVVKPGVVLNGSIVL